MSDGHGELTLAMELQRLGAVLEAQKLEKEQMSAKYEAHLVRNRERERLKRQRARNGAKKA